MQKDESEAKPPTSENQQAHPALPSSQTLIYFLSSLSTGVITTGIFNPMDRALYLAIIKKRPLWVKANFVSPYQGCLSAMGQKSIFGSLYYITQDQAKIHLQPYLLTQLHSGEVVANIGVGCFAGSIHAIFSNPLNSVKYQTWGDDEACYLKTAQKMWKMKQLEPFIRGTRATIYRGITFGSIYEVLRNLLRQKLNPEETQKPQNKLMTVDFAANTTSAILSTIAASPFNYARNIQYKMPLQQPAPTVKEILISTHKESKTQNKTLLSRINFFSKTFQLGWGTVRVGVGIATGQIIFDEAKKQFTKHLS
ncbi:MAG TPA: hypothetical protein VLH77_00880 [Gammaproteobacteria bacterium]|nr:hypothetical protein [Gammaproteobacteria bacterium]